MTAGLARELFGWRGAIWCPGGQARAIWYAPLSALWAVRFAAELRVDCWTLLTSYAMAWRDLDDFGRTRARPSSAILDERATSEACGETRRRSPPIAPLRLQVGSAEAGKVRVCLSCSTAGAARPQRCF